MRIEPAVYKKGLRKRYKDLRDLVHSSRLVGLESNIDHDNNLLREMRMIASIARLHGIEIKE